MTNSPEPAARRELRSAGVAETPGVVLADATIGETVESVAVA